MGVEEQVGYWTTGSAEDLAAGQTLLEKGYLRHGLFFAHLALEKMRKAHVVRTTHQVPPRIHNLIRLARLAGMNCDGDQQRFLRRFDVYQLEGRYPDSQRVTLDLDRARQEIQKAAEMLQWLKAKL